MKCFLDLDGVLVDVVGGILKRYNIDFDMSQWPVGEYIVHRAVGRGLTATDLWESPGYNFWAEMDWMPDGREILAQMNLLFGPENIFFLSAPTTEPECLSGKMAWLQKHIPYQAERAIFTKQKQLLAHKDRILVDDYDANIKAYTEAGGPTVLFPRLWNSAYKQRHNALEEVIHQIETIRRST